MVFGLVFALGDFLPSGRYSSIIEICSCLCKMFFVQVSTLYSFLFFVSEMFKLNLLSTDKILLLSGVENWFSSL